MEEQGIERMQIKCDYKTIMQSVTVWQSLWKSNEKKACREQTARVGWKGDGLSDNRLG